MCVLNLALTLNLMQNFGISTVVEEIMCRAVLAVATNLATMQVYARSIQLWQKLCVVLY